MEKRALDRRLDQMRAGVEFVTGANVGSTSIPSVSARITTRCS
jgi:hypothetical protein